MSKEYLEALEGMFDLIKSQGSFEKAQKYYDIIGQALDRLESIENSSPSEALECLEEIKTDWKWCLHTPVIEYRFVTVEQALLNVQKEHRALEIIVKKNVDIQGIIISKDVDSYNREYSKYFRAINCKQSCEDKSCNWGNLLIPEGNDYRMKWIGCKATLLTEEEFNLVKEVLECVKN